YKDGFEAADHVMEILEFDPIGLEGFEGSIVEALRKKRAPNIELLPEGGGFLLVEFGGDDPAEVQETAKKLVERLNRLAGAPSARIYNPAEARAIWHIRES